MPATALKDYYKILDIPTSATAAEVKKAFRAMAFKYHPDTNAGDVYAESYFRDVQEAYSVLGDEMRRAQYDNDRWLSGMTDRARNHEQVTPMWMLKETIKLDNHMATIDVYRMNHKALHAYLMQLLNDSHMAMLLQREEPSVNESIVEMILKSTRSLKLSFMLPVASLLMQLAGDDAMLQGKIDAALKARRREHRWLVLQPYVIAALTLLLVMCMYLWSAK